MYMTCRRAARADLLCALLRQLAYAYDGCLPDAVTPPPRRFSYVSLGATITIDYAAPLLRHFALISSTPFCFRYSYADTPCCRRYVYFSCCCLRHVFALMLAAY